MKTEEAATRFLSNLPTLRRHRRVPTRRSRLQSSARSALNGGLSHGSVEKINYPGIGNNSKFGYDPKGQNVQIAETKMSALVSNSEIIWSRGERCESRDAMNGASSKYFSRGQVDSTVLTTASKFRFFDALGSIRSITDASGSEVSALDYSPFGVPQLVLGSYMSEFQFAGYFFHSPSSLDFALRAGSQNSGQ